MISFTSLLFVSKRIISIVGILLCAAVVAGVWTINGALTRGLTGSLTGIEFVINIAEKNTHRVEAVAIGLQGKLETIQQQIRQTNSEGTGFSVTPAVLDKVIDLDLETRLAAANEIVIQIHETVASVNQLVETANTLPFFSIPPLPESDIDTIGRHLADMQDAARNVASISVDLQANGTGEAVSTLITHLDNLHALALDIEAPVAAFSNSAAAAKRAATRIIDRLSAWIFIGSILLSLVFIWFTYAQGCVYMHARP